MAVGDWVRQVEAHRLDTGEAGAQEEEEENSGEGRKLTHFFLVWGISLILFLFCIACLSYL